MGAKDGETVGDGVGETLGAKVGDTVGSKVGQRVGCLVVASLIWFPVGVIVGDKVGAKVGERVGSFVVVASPSDTVGVNWYTASRKLPPRRLPKVSNSLSHSESGRRFISGSACRLRHCASPTVTDPSGHSIPKNAPVD